MKHITNTHPECIPAKRRSLLDRGCTLKTGGDVAPHSPKLPAGDNTLNNGELLAGDDAQNTANQFAANCSRTAPGNESPEPDRQVPIATAQIARGKMGQRFWRYLTTSLDNVIKANSIAQVIPSA
jgi:hypothetical protein